MKYQCLHCMRVYGNCDYAMTCCSVEELSDEECSACPKAGENCDDIECDECLGTGWCRKEEKSA